MKKCQTCKKTKADREYYANKANKDGLQSSCKKCQAATNAQWKKDNKARVNKQNAEAGKRRLAKDPEGERAKRAKWARDWYKRNKSS